MKVHHLDRLAVGEAEETGAGLDPRDNRLRHFEGCVCLGAMPPRQQLARIWFKDQRWVLLFNALIRSSSWIAERPVPLRVAELAHLSGLSGQSVLLALRQAREAGDFVSARADADRRRLVMEPSEQIRSLALWQRDTFLVAITSLTGRADPTRRLPPEAERAWSRLFFEASFTAVGWSCRRAASLSTVDRALLLWDLIKGGPQGSAQFVGRQVALGRASRQTIRNHLAWLREGGWLAPGKLLVPSDMARRRFATMLDAFERRAHLMLDLLEALAADPGISPCLRARAGLEGWPEGWEPCRIRLGERPRQGAADDGAYPVAPAQPCCAGADGALAKEGPATPQELAGASPGWRQPA